MPAQGAEQKPPAQPPRARRRRSRCRREGAPRQPPAPGRPRPASRPRRPPGSPRRPAAPRHNRVPIRRTRRRRRAPRQARAAPAARTGACARRGRPPRAAAWAPAPPPNPRRGPARPAHRRREEAAAEHRPADPDPRAAVPGHPLRRGRRAGRQRRPEAATGDLLDRTASGVPAGQVDHQRRADRERQLGPGSAAAASTSSTCSSRATPAKIWADFTAANVGTQTAFTLDSKVVSAPEVREPIPGGRTQITGTLHRRDGARTGQRLEVRFAAAVVRVLGGRNRLGDTGFDVPAGGLDRGRGRACTGAALLTALLPGAGSADRTVAGGFRRNGFRDPGAPGQIHRLHARPGRHRGSDHRYRYDRRLVRGVLRTHQG